jgi:iron complex transport system substrate-binding protein
MRKAILLLLLSLVASCGRAGEASPDRTAGRPRVVSLHDVTTEMIVALGAADRLVGVGEPVDPSSEVKAKVAAVPRVGGLESVLAVRPDVLLGLGIVGERDPDLVARAQALGISVVLADPETLADVYALTRLVAAHAGDAPAGEALVARMQDRIGPDPAAAGKPLRVFVYDCCDPPFTAGRRAVLSDLIRRAGGHNVFAHLDAKWTHVSWEEAVAERPELIVVHDYAYEGQRDIEGKRATLRRIPSLESVPVVVLPLGDSLGGLRSVDGLGRLRTAIREHS